MILKNKMWHLKFFVAVVGVVVVVVCLKNFIWYFYVDLKYLIS